MRCEECGFDFDEVPVADLPQRLRFTADALAERLTGAPAAILDWLPAPNVWSARQYGAHVRDVLLNLRDRALLALLEERPRFAPIHREERVRAARYTDEPAALIASAITVGAELLAFLYEHLEDSELERQGVYAGVDRDVLWIGRQALHEATHHLLDVDRCLRASVADPPVGA